MTTTARPGRFQTFPAMANGRDEKTAPGAAQAFGSNHLYTTGSNIWTTTYGGPAKANAGNARAEDAFTTQPSGSGALAAGSEADTWGQGPWNQDGTQTRSASGSTSPNRTRDNLHNSTSSFFDNATIGQGRGFINGRPKSFLEEDKENTSFGASFNSPYEGYARQEKRGSKETAYLAGLGAVGAPSRDSSIPPSRQSDDSHHSPPAFRDTFGGYGHTPSNSIASTRPMPAHSSSFPSQTTNQRAFLANNRQMEDSDLASTFKKSMTLDDGSGIAQTIGGGAPGFQFNPGSQPWRADVNGAFPDAYADPVAQQQYKRGSIASISGTPAQYRVVTSPKTYASQQTDPWRSSSRDLRMVSDGDRRTPVQPFIPAQAPTFFPTGPYYNPNFAGQFAPQVYDPYIRQQIPMPGYGLHMAPYSISGVVPIRATKDQDPSKGMRSMLLEEFRSSSKSNKRYELKDIYSHVVEFSGDQHGSRFIQQKLETANSDEKDQVFREIEPNAIQLMKDVFGNYVIQKFFEHGNQVQKKVLASQMKGKVVDLSMQMYACRVVQKALEHVLVEQQAELVKELEPEIVKVVKDQNGNHVVQKIIELVPRHYINFIMDSFRGQVSTLASHMYACRVIQRMLEYGTEQDKETILGELHNSTQSLITDQYGNYVVQHIIEHGKPEDRSRIIQLVISQLVTLSKHKFASNVVEKCIQFGTAEERKGIREQITSQASDGTSSLQLMMKDQYGNYVIQKLLNLIEGSEREAFIEEMKPQFNLLRKTSTSRQLAAIDRLLYATQTLPSKSGGSQADSTAPTPVLTMEPNSPQSSSPPSTNASAIGEVADDDNKSGVPGGVSLKVQVEEA
ncbi:Pumilio 2 [Colletotrichum fructicola]|uniref:Pumilio homology domain family member 3 n=1 Tax=Colletotrichum fructicola (strain Nara gc5) TaxID=1213859 RepID=A0A7J6JQ45_COLFN|nr:Pumilio 2 [Colletotrichum fructicola]KAE9576903.1 Pumilio 2 [Colletotrichum fructicola]KAF4413377.1 Pumilio-like protein 2 [Colletotrichum fructicola]KAF4492665.1 Pumilio-like protein 2 [Colletotrichum fructicola Nara gc5]KAF5514301.1 Pumilio-like protein 2 [Colletotrichum fructicola]